MGAEVNRCDSIMFFQSLIDNFHHKDLFSSGAQCMSNNIQHIPKLDLVMSLQKIVQHCQHSRGKGCSSE